MRDVDQAEQSARVYAADLLKRVAGTAFDYHDVAVLARIIPEIEADALRVLALEADRAAIRAGLHRTEDARQALAARNLPQ